MSVTSPGTGTATGAQAEEPLVPTRRIAYIVSRFPVVTETFILREMDELERLGARIDLFTLVHDDPEVVQDTAAVRVDAMVAANTAGVGALVAAQLHWLRRRPIRLTSLWARALWGNRSSAKFLSRALATVPAAALFARRIDEVGVDHIHAHWATHPALAAHVAAGLTDLPYSVTAHAHDIYVDQAMLVDKLAGAAFVATISELNRDYLRRMVPSLGDRCAVVRCGVPRAQLAERPRRRRSGSVPHISCVASMKPYKGHRHLLAALRLLADRGVDFRCSLAGGGDEFAGLRDLSRSLGLDERVRFLGAIDSGAVQELLADTDLFVLPSTIEPSGKTEGIPVALMEAMAGGVPVVASDVSAMSELISDGISGLLVKPGDETALADALVRCIDDPDAAEARARRGLSRVAEDFLVESNVARLAGLFTIPIPASARTTEPALVAERI